MTYQLRNRTETALWGTSLGKLLRPGDLVALIGDLGAGKTTLTQALARGMGVIDAVTSPTFTLVQEYSGPIPLFHFDPYRLDHPEEMADLGFDEYLERGGVVVVEWADTILELLPTNRIELTLEIESSESEDSASTLEFQEDAPRRLTAHGQGARPHTLLNRLARLPEIEALQILEKTG